MFVEVQIRNVEMNRQAKFGIASHWIYKEHDTSPKYRDDEEWNELIRMLEEENYDPQEFVARAQNALLKDEVLVQTPKGKLVSLPRGSTAIDFAYAIHTELGHSAGGAKINGTRVPLYQRLENGDVIEIVKRDVENPAPDPEWLEWAKSPRTLLKIRKWFRMQPKRRRIEIGRELLYKQIQRRGLYPLNLLAADKLVSILRLLKAGSIHDIYDRIALGDLTTGEVLKHLKQVQMERTLKAETESSQGRYKLEAPFIASGMELNLFDTRGRKTRLKMELSACCRPIPGDEIAGYYADKSKRLIVHCAQCGFLKQMEDTRMRYELKWDEEGERKHYPVAIEIVCLNRAGLMYDVLGLLAGRGINIVASHFETQFSTLSEPYRAVYIDFLIEIRDTGELALALEEIKSIPDIIAARRLADLPSAGGVSAAGSPDGAKSEKEGDR
jgi:GTP pyrophosphokinase